MMWLLECSPPLPGGQSAVAVEISHYEANTTTVIP